jgi:hypothetical protein
MGELATILLAFSDAQLDAAMHPLIKAWDKEPTALQILEVLDHCIHGALASSFVVSALQAYYELALKREGKKHEDMVPLATWRDRD